MDFEKLMYLVVGAIIGFIVSLLKDLLMENKKNKIRKEIYRKERLEELYVLVGNWSKKLMGNSLSLLAVMHNKIHYNDYNDITIEDATKVTYDFNRIEMILDIYAPELLSAYSIVIKAREELNNIAMKHRREYNNGNTDGRIFVNDYIKAQDNFEDTIKVLQKEIAKLSLNI